MILKLGMHHQALELYKVYINHDPWMTLTYFMTRSTKVAYAFSVNIFIQIYKIQIQQEIQIHNERI